MRINQLDFDPNLSVGGTMWGVFWCSRFWMLVSLEHFVDIIWHAQLDGSLGVIPFEGDSNKK